MVQTGLDEVALELVGDALAALSGTPGDRAPSTRVGGGRRRRVGAPGIDRVGEVVRDAVPIAP